jgi:hypothetical protein
VDALPDSLGSVVLQFVAHSITSFPARSQTMTRTKRVAAGAFAALLAAAPVASAWAGGYGPHYGNRGHYGHHHYNPLYPVVGLAAAVVGTAAAIVTLPFAVLGAAAAQVPAYYPPAPAARAYYPPQASVAPPPGYGSGSNGYAPYAYYPAPASSNSYAPAPPQYAYPSRAPNEGTRYPQYGDFDGYRGPAANGYYRQDVPPAGGYYAPRPGAYASPYADSYSYSSSNQR